MNFPELIAFGVLVLAGIAEWLHARRAARVAALAFGEMSQGVVLKGVIIGLAVLTNFTSFQRIAWVWRYTRSEADGAAAGAESAGSETTSREGSRIES